MKSKYHLTYTDVYGKVRHLYVNRVSKLNMTIKNLHDVGCSEFIVLNRKTGELTE